MVDRVETVAEHASQASTSTRSAQGSRHGSEANENRQTTSGTNRPNGSPCQRASRRIPRQIRLRHVRTTSVKVGALRGQEFPPPESANPEIHHPHSAIDPLCELCVLRGENSTSSLSRAGSSSVKVRAVRGKNSPRRFSPRPKIHRPPPVPSSSVIFPASLSVTSAISVVENSFINSASVDMLRFRENQ